MNYKTVFEISANSNGVLSDFYNTLFIESMILLLGVGLGIYVIVKFKTLKPTACLTPLFFLFWAIIGLHATISSRPNNRYLESYEKGNYLIAEGDVKVLYRQPQTGHAPGDQIVVDGRKFTIDYFQSTRTYKTTIAQGGVLRHGAYVKLYHVNGNILRVDLRDSLIKDGDVKESH